MAQNITIAGASYSDVPFITVPKTGGGTASFIDTTIASGAAAASDILSGKYAWANGVLLKGTGSGGGGGGLVYETGTWTPTEDVSKPTISFANAHSNRPFFVMMTDTSEETQDSNYMLCWFMGSWYDAFGFGVCISSSQLNYARTQAIYSTGSNFSTGAGNVSFLTGQETYPF